MEFINQLIMALHKISPLHLDGIIVHYIWIKNNIFAEIRGNWVYRSNDLGLNWMLINGGMDHDKYVLSSENTRNGFLFSGMDYNGIYRSANQVLSFNDNDNYLLNFV
jgi:hypothetical protein